MIKRDQQKSTNVYILGRREYSLLSSKQRKKNQEQLNPASMINKLLSQGQVLLQQFTALGGAVTALYPCICPRRCP